VKKLWYQNSDCGTDPTKLTCFMSMKSLQESPYFLPIGADIVTRVSASNKVGYSVLSLDSRSNLKVIKPLEKIEAPKLQRIDYESMKVTWKILKTAETYTLVWDKGTPQGIVAEAILADTNVLTHTVAGLDPAKDYRFRVRG
jgi:hypothetical protein